MKVDLLIKNAAELITCKTTKPKIREELNNLGIVANGAVAVKDNEIIFVGKTKDVDFQAKRVIDADNKVVMPGFVDCHTHAIYAGSREKEWVKKLQGVSYEEISKRGGGILSTVEKTRNATKKNYLILPCLA